jgi:uncharacterized coiled-coil protein SlyX
VNGFVPFNSMLMKTKIPSFFIILLTIGLGLSQNAHGVTPPPDGGYPNQNTAEGDNALLSLTTGTNNTATGNSSLSDNTTGNNNTATGAGALLSNTGGNQNTALGSLALNSNTTGERNTATGFNALEENTAGNLNTANGYNALYYSTGSDNIGLGANGGVYLRTGSHNIDIGNTGMPSDTGKIRIGTQGMQTKTFITGIANATVTGSAVYIDTTSGQLGLLSSSKRFKDGIEPMGNTSEALLSLRPVTFRYKKNIDPKGAAQFGLVAEEVEKVNPDLVVRDENGEIYTVRYDAVNAMLLNEFLKEHRAFLEQQRKIEAQEATIAQLKSTVAKQEATTAQEQRQIEALTAGLQKVSAQLEASKPAPQVVNNP